MYFPYNRRKARTPPPDEEKRQSKKTRAADRPLSSLRCKCRVNCLRSFSQADFESEATRYAAQNEREALQYVLNLINTSTALRRNSRTHLQYYIKGTPVCKHAFTRFYLITDYKMKEARKLSKYCTLLSHLCNIDWHSP